MTRSRIPMRDQRGTSLVEFAIALPLIAALLLGIFTGGQAWARKVSIVDAVREGGRYGATLVVPSGSGGATTWETNVRNRIVSLSGGELQSGDVCVKLVLPIGGTDCGVADPPGASTESSVHVVKVSASRSTSLEFVFFTMNPTLSGRMVARYERDTG